MQVYSSTKLTPSQKLLWGAVSAVQDKSSSWLVELELIKELGTHGEADVLRDIGGLVDAGFIRRHKRQSGREIAVTHLFGVGLGCSAEQKALAGRLIDEIVRLSGRRFQKADSYLQSITLRLDENRSLDEKSIIHMLRFMWERWGDDPKMSPHFNPTTLFRKQNFARYCDEAAASRSEAEDKPEVRVVINQEPSEVEFSEQDRAAAERLLKGLKR